MRNRVLILTILMTTTVLAGCTVDSTDDSAQASKSPVSPEGTDPVRERPMTGGMTQPAQTDGGHTPQEAGTVMAMLDAVHHGLSDSGAIYPIK